MAQFIEIIEHDADGNVIAVETSEVIECKTVADLEAMFAIYMPHLKEGR